MTRRDIMRNTYNGSTGSDLPCKKSRTAKNKPKRGHLWIMEDEQLSI